jgi:hypothetical protein
MELIKDITVSPSYGKNTALIRWRPDATVAHGNFIVQKSNDGITAPWVTIGSDFGLTEFVDTSFLVPNKHTQIHYRVIVQANGKRYDSQSVATFSKLRRNEFGLLHRMLSLENLRMNAARNGIEVVLLKQRISGPPCDCVDPDTKQELGTTLCEDCYGTGVKGGYYDPIYTYAEILTIDNNIQYDTSGKDVTDSTPVTFHIIAYPELRKGDLIVKKDTDERFIVNDVNPFMFRGVVPFTYQVNAELLHRDHVRYKVPIKECEDDVG